jgi:translation elongation factor EF-Ts
MVIVTQETFLKARKRKNRCFRSTQVNCETDFVGKNDNFQDLARKCAEVALGLGDAGQAIADIDPEALKNASMRLSRTHFLSNAYSPFSLGFPADVEPDIRLSDI